MNKLLSYLSAIHPLSPGLQAHLESILEVRELKQKDLILDIGEICRHIYFIESGLFRAYYLGQSEEICAWFMKENDVMTSRRSFYQQVPSRERIEALEPSKVHYISYEQLEDTYRLYPEFNIFGRMLSEKYYHLLDEQMRLLHMTSPRQRYDFFLKYHAEIERRVPRNDLASYLVMDLETLSRIGGDEESI